MLTLYLDLPDTPLRTSVSDQRQARLWFDRGVPLEVVGTALLLACLRRKVRPPEAPPLPRIRSLAYFQPVIEELLELPAPAGYLPYLRLKLRHVVDNPPPAKVQKSTLSDDLTPTTQSPGDKQENPQHAFVGGWRSSAPQSAKTGSQTGGVAVFSSRSSMLLSGRRHNLGSR